MWTPRRFPFRIADLLSANMPAREMIGILFQLMLLAQSGTVAGILTTEAARPAAGVRIAALAQPENPSKELRRRPRDGDKRK